MLKVGSVMRVGLFIFKICRFVWCSYTDRFVGLGDIAISSVPGDMIKTFALASCVGITAYCSSLHIAGMIHIVLPSRPKNSSSASAPGYYASTGVPIFIHRLLSLGCKKNELVLNVYGGAYAINKGDFFNIGLHNIHAVQNSLKRLNVSYLLTDVGGCISRTLFMDVSTGAVKISKLPIIT